MLKHTEHDPEKWEPVSEKIMLKQARPGRAGPAPALVPREGCDRGRQPQASSHLGQVGQPAVTVALIVATFCESR